MTYNILNGGSGSDGSSDGDGDRLARVADVVAGQAPHLVGVQELGRRALSDPDGPLRRLADRLGMRAYASRSRLPGGQPVALLVHPSLPVLTAAAVPGPLHHGAVRVDIATDAGPLTVVTTHLCPFAGWRRLGEARCLIAALTRDGRLAGPHARTLLLGDQNSLDPWTDHTTTVDHLPQRYRRRHLRRDGTVDTRAVAALADAGLHDLSRPAGTPQAPPSPPAPPANASPPADASPRAVPSPLATRPTPTVPTGYAGAEFAPMRLDYLLGTDAVRSAVQEYRVITAGAARTASDHYPVVLRTTLRAAANTT